MGPVLPDWAAPLVDRYLQVDTADTDAALLAVSRLDRDDPLDGVVTFWDRDVELVAEITRKIGLPGCPPEAAHRVRNKYLLRERLRECGLPQPRYRSFSTWEQLREAADEIGLPLVCKPWGSGGSKGIFKILDESELRPAYAAMVRHVVPGADPMFRFHPGRFVAEECITGLEVSIEGAVAHGVPHIVGITEKWTHPRTCQEWQHAFPARLPPATAAAVTTLAAQAVVGLQLDNCVFHAEVMITPTGGQLIEVNGRIGGDLIHTHLVPLGCGADLIEAAYHAALGERVSLSRLWSRGACVRFLLADRAGRVREWHGVAAATASRDVVEFGVEKNTGDSVALPPIRFQDERLCYVVTCAESTDEAICSAERALDRVQCVIA
jgi:biotin carboxylase